MVSSVGSAVSELAPLARVLRFGGRLRSDRHVVSHAAGDALGLLHQLRVLLAGELVGEDEGHYGAEQD
jgi:hypothetical protein